MTPANGRRRGPRSHWRWRAGAAGATLRRGTSDTCAAALEDDLRGRCRYLGDVFLLSEIIVNEELLERRDVEAYRRVFAGGGVRSWELAVDLPAGDPLRGDAAHFCPPSTQLLFEPVAGGGVGVPPELILMECRNHV